MTHPPALIVNPTKVDDVAALHREVSERCQARGLPGPVLYETTADDAGEQITATALRAGASLVLAAGGDGTVRAVCCALRGTGVPLGILPMGTGNLLARNLDLPLDLADSIEVAVSGSVRVLDLAQITADDAPPTCFAVMAGLGFDAQMMADAPESLKARMGWPAYLLSGLRHLRDDSAPIAVALDDAAPVARRVRGVVVGNVGALQGGVQLLPDARPDDGRLDVVVLAPRRVLDWGRLLGRLLVRSSREDQSLERQTALKIELRAEQPTEAQLDGDPLGKVSHLVVEVLPGALTVKVSP